MTEDQMQGIVEALIEVSSDNTVPRNVKKKLSDTADILKTEEEELIRINKAINELEELLEDQNMQAYTRTQILNILSMLEMI